MIKKGHSRYCGCKTRVGGFTSAMVGETRRLNRSWGQGCVTTRDWRSRARRKVMTRIEMHRERLRDRGARGEEDK
jgi:hypothetical protein